MSNEPIPREAKLLIQLGEIQSQLWRARDRAWKLARERNHWKSECLEQARLLAMSADREEKLVRERDEANRELHKQLVRYDELFDEAEKIRMERDEAREALQ